MDNQAKLTAIAVNFKRVAALLDSFFFDTKPKLKGIYNNLNFLFHNGFSFFVIFNLLVIRVF
ncbi:hypothetical protein N783_02370 [Pontibacillus marinus BH030004 = DSM 16465]|uniref:Uncharacterized protein n=1 Tax=Pontibacillus marinus BH030004 = DSM 16465 TaxID=1385511 RepID=A0A0A5GFR9_9BACI|nr:hypothetical protein N783_02370 [Pontibacillus marinus BH030004 = DSM 16465]